MLANYYDRKKRKSDFRSLWITRINAAVRQEGLSYSKFIAALKKSGIELNRKMLAYIVVNDSAGFKAIVDKLK
ncbi:Ribosomal protein L20 [Candidatus Omnitrophus magneticus]|uniref:Large ribosomal subunit protein bL20 n=1 Tax=Candidatus Omnitrophus magneticus TaxID=1609969 RepID=A0A0F0CVJ7_9BACT|nr:Ribosomal protein L20 [Candidatus Omnitrophus magneticus]